MMNNMEEPTFEEICDVVSRQFGVVLKSKYNMNSYAGPRPVRVGLFRNEENNFGSAVPEADVDLVLNSIVANFQKLSDGGLMQLHDEVGSEAANWRIVTRADEANMQHLRAV